MNFLLVLLVILVSQSLNLIKASIFAKTFHEIESKDNSRYIKYLTRAPIQIINKNINPKPTISTTNLGTTEGYTNNTEIDPISSSATILSATDKPDVEHQGVVVRGGDCSFRLSEDIHEPAPLFSKAGHYEWVIPNPAGVVEMKNGQYIDMYCTNSFVAPFTNRTKISAQCLQDLYFLVDGTIYRFNNFRCTEWPTYTARRTGRNCSGGTDLLEVGFVVSGGFLQTMDICHDEDNEVTRYVHHILNPSSAAYQRSVARPRFIEGDFYNGKNVDNLYTKVQQNITLSKILGMDASPYFYDSIDIYMARGHLAAKTDFIFAAPQMSSFFFVNVAPQWQAFNGGNWERIEDGVRKFVANNNLTTDCYTGTWGVSALPDVNGTQQELYLDFDENNNGLIPVPKIYFRVVIDRTTRKGIVLIGINNPHISVEQIQKEYVICKDIGDQIDWIQWAREDLYKGYCYACSVPDFLKTVKHLPISELETTGVLGIKKNKRCIFRVNGDLNDPIPLLTPHGALDWIVPNPDGNVYLKHGESMDMYCTKSFMAPFENVTSLTAKCLSDSAFLVDHQKYNFSNFRCSAWPIYTARRTGRNCSGGSDLLEVGFEVENGFLKTMDICHDEANEVTRYVYHVLNPSSSAFQRSVVRPSFKTGDFFAGKNVDSFYSQKQQNDTFSSILGVDASIYFKGTNIYLARGHMAAKVDFIFGSPQRATFFFVNAAPQWQAFNAGNWERIEDGVRKFVSTNNMTANCYTGVWGISTLPDVNGTHRELYMTFDENNNGLIPVPMIYFRVVINQATREGIVLIGVNNPHASLDEVMAKYVICEDIGHHIDWINWSKDDLKKGYSYACSVPDFIRVVKTLPLADLYTTGVLGVN